MPRATTRRNATQSQSNGNSQEGSRTQKKQRGHRVEVQEEDGDGDDREDEDEEMEDRVDEGESGSTTERRANDLVRLALFTETRRGTLRREDITKKIFGGRVNKNDFEQVFDRAQQVLHKTFGMELHEMMSRAERLKADAARDGANVDGDTNMGPAKKKATTASKQYILRSVLDDAIIEAASVWDAEIESAEKKEISTFYPDDDDRQPEGTLIAWRQGGNDHLAQAGILHVILALILVNGRVLNDMQLRTYLKRLRLPIGCTMPSNTSQTTKSFTIETYLSQLTKQGYLDRQKINNGTQGPQKRGRTSAATLGEDSDANYEWKWGTRALAEIGEAGIRDFTVAFMDGIDKNRRGEEGEEEPDEEETEKQAADRLKREQEKSEKQREKLVTAIGRAAGGGIESYK
ncbi:hypothetical protein M422DRAFT_202312 [Sphaerobolus stellatus SS14]|nr:hypothetical protein M422DRAFT_202312 [Sphaerobolus stellatus SS14]